jgi:hypothetical protein
MFVPVRDPGVARAAPASPRPLTPGYLPLPLRGIWTLFFIYVLPVERLDSFVEFCAYISGLVQAATPRELDGGIESRVE